MNHYVDCKLKLLAITEVSRDFFFYPVFLSRTFTMHKTTREGEVNSLSLHIARLKPRTFGFRVQVANH